MKSIEEIRKYQLLIPCQCYGEVLLTEVTDDDFADQELWLAIYRYKTWRVKFRRRLQLAWRFLRTGDFYQDQIVMHPSDALRLAQFINDRFKKST